MHREILHDRFLESLEMLYEGEMMTARAAPLHGVIFTKPPCVLLYASGLQFKFFSTLCSIGQDKRSGVNYGWWIFQWTTCAANLSQCACSWRSCSQGQFRKGASIVEFYVSELGVTNWLSFGCPRDEWPVNFVWHTHGSIGEKFPFVDGATETVETPAESTVGDLKTLARLVQDIQSVARRLIVTDHRINHLYSQILQPQHVALFMQPWKCRLQLQLKQHAYSI